MRLHARTLVCSMLAAAAVSAFSAHAQTPPGADRLSYPAIVESLAVLRKLSDRVKSHYNDPAAWFRQGMIAWALNERCRRQPRFDVLDCTRTRLLADTALMIAGELDSGKGNYVSAFTQFLLTSEATFRREAPYLDRLFRSSLKRMRENPDPVKHADGAIDAGQLYWLRYDVTAHRNEESTPSTLVRDYALKVAPDRFKTFDAREWLTRDAMQSARAVLDGKKQAKAKEFAGESDYVRAEAYFREAYDAAPTYLRAYRHLAILVAERNRWPELHTLATERVRRVPGDEWAWMTLGLAEYRRGNKGPAAAAFDSAQRRMTDPARKQLLRIDRVLDTRQRLSYDEAHDRYSATFWALVDPLWSRSDDDPHLEYIARVAYAELVWSSEQLNEHGVDSDRGAIYVRWGPPDRIMTMRDDRVGKTLANGTATGSIYWEYDDPTRDYSSRVFRFNRIPSYRTLAFVNDTTVANGPRALWDDLVFGRIDSIPVQIARFRGRGDSVDVFVAAQPPIESIRRSSDLPGPVRTDFWMATDVGVPVIHDSTFSSDAGQRAFTTRVQAGQYMYRTEATGVASRIAARATATVMAGDDSLTGFMRRGFGMSDIVLATRAEPRTPAPARWTDIDMTALLGAPHPGDQLSLVWETYGLGAADGQARYDVVITMRPEGAPRPRPGAPPPPGIAARIIGGIAGAFGIDRQVIGDRVEFRFSRALPHHDTVVDNIAILLADTPPGGYHVMVTTTDRATGLSTYAFRRVRVAPPPVARPR